MTQKFENLAVWQKARLLTKDLYLVTDTYPIKEQFGLISQTNRAVVSIVCNIAEGSGRPSKKDFSHFLDIAIGSGFELESLIILATDLNYINQSTKNKLLEKIIEIEKMINGLKRTLLI